MCTAADASRTRASLLEELAFGALVEVVPALWQARRWTVDRAGSITLFGGPHLDALQVTTDSAP
jgi:hypothetical protein